jgi:hypothetical protein
MTIARARAQEIALQFTADFPGALELVFFFRDSVSELYGSRANSLSSKLKGGYVCAPTEFEGKVYNGRVDVPLDNMDDEVDLGDSLRHEVLGHYGLNTLPPETKHAVLATIVASRDEPSMKGIWRDIDEWYTGSSLELRAEEVFARRCESLPDPADIAQVTIDAGRSAFRECCIERQRPLTLRDLGAIACVVADGLCARDCKQLTFPGVNDIQRRFAERSAPKAHSMTENTPRSIINKVSSDPRIEAQNAKLRKMSAAMSGGQNVDTAPARAPMWDELCKSVTSGKPGIYIVCAEAGMGVSLVAEALAEKAGAARVRFAQQDMEPTNPTNWRRCAKFAREGYSVIIPMHASSMADVEARLHKLRVPAEELREVRAVALVESVDRRMAARGSEYSPPVIRQLALNDNGASPFAGASSAFALGSGISVPSLSGGLLGAIAGSKAAPDEPATRSTFRPR